MMKFVCFAFFLIPLVVNYWLLMNFIIILGFMFIFLSTYYNFISSSYSFLGIDTLSFSLTGLTFFITFLMFMASFSIYNSSDNIYFFSFIVLVLMLILCFTFFSLNVMMFYIFFECSLIPTFFLIFGWGYQPERIPAGYYLIFYTLFASFPLLLGIFYIYVLYYSLDFWLIKVDTCSFYLYLSFILAFLFKMPISFFHFWLPKAHVEAPISGSMVLAGILLKLGGYGLLRVYLFIGNYSLFYNFYWIVLSLLGSFMISFLCLFQIDMKSVIAYSSVAHMSLVICGIMSFTYYGFYGSLVLMIGHGFCSSALFCLSNFAYERSCSRSLLINKGYMISMPGMTFFWFFFCCNNMASPPSLNLLGEIYIMNSLINWDSMTFIFIFILSFMSCCYSIYIFSTTQHGSLYSGYIKIYSSSVREYLLMILHLIPLNLLFMKIDIFMNFI